MWSARTTERFSGSDTFSVVSSERSGFRTRSHVCSECARSGQFRGAVMDAVLYLICQAYSPYCTPFWASSTCSPVSSYSKSCWRLYRLLADVLKLNESTHADALWKGWWLYSSRSSS